MSETILVGHPAPVRHVPKGGRNERLTIARIETPAVLNSLDPDAFAIPRTAEGSVVPGNLRIRDGRFWAPLEVKAHGARAAVRADSFRMFLRGELSGVTSQSDALTHLFRQSHLVACHGVPVRLDKTETRLERGDAVDVDASRSIAHDGREDCARALAAWLADEVAIVGDGVWMRVSPLVRYEHDGQRHDLTVSAHPFSLPGALPHFGFGSFEEGVATYRNDWDRVPERSDELTGILAMSPAAHRPEESLAYLANILVEDIFRIRKTHFGFLNGAEEIEAVKDKLLRLRYAGMTGRISEAEAPDALRLVRVAAGICVERNPGNFSSWSLERACRYLDTGILPRFEQVADADADAMSGLVR